MPDLPPALGATARARPHATQCSGCGKPIVWIARPIEPDKPQATCPTDPRAVVYVVYLGKDSKPMGITGSEFLERLEKIILKDGKEVRAEQILGLFVTHFATCPQVSRFAGRSKR